MKVNIVGAGPAGTYFAAALKQRVPNADITILEKNPKDKIGGLGYVLQQTSFDQLGFVDSSVIANLNLRDKFMWDSFHIESKGAFFPGEFNSSVGIKRSEIVEYLRNLAESSGVVIKYDTTLTAKQVDELRKSSDLLVGADGQNSMIRRQYAKEIDPSVYQGTNSFSWLGSYCMFKNMHVSINQHNNGVFITTSYPIDTDLHSTIIECPTSEVEQLTGSVEERLEKLSWIISTPLRMIALKKQKIKWYKSKANNCKQIGFENVALIGEAGVSTHYSSGIGLHLAFVAGQNLARSLVGTVDTSEAIQEYQGKTIPYLKEAHDFSLLGIRAYERLNDVVKKSSGEEVIKLFKHRDSPLYQ